MHFGSFGGRVADAIKPSHTDSWLGAHDWAPATRNLCKNVLGKIVLADGKVPDNPPAWSSSERRKTPAFVFCRMQNARKLLKIARTPERNYEPYGKVER